MDKDVRIGLLNEALRSVARQCEALAERIGAPVKPGHVNYLNKKDAATFAQSIADQARAALDK